MNRKILLQVTAPAAVIGLLLFVTCLVTAWLVDRLQMNRSKILSQNVTSLEAAQELEISLRQLRFYCFLYLIDPNQPLLEQINSVNEAFQRNFERAKNNAFMAEERQLVRQIQQGYEQYQEEFQRLRVEVTRSGPRRNFRELADSNPIRHVVEPCDQLLQINKEMIQQTSHESDRISYQLRWALMLLGVGGPVSGLILGYGVARGLSRSIYRLSVHVHDVAQRLEENVASLTLAPDGDIATLDQQLLHVIGRLKEVAQRMQQHQREMLRAQQLSAVGQLAASVAHEVRNPLTSIKMLVEAAWRSRNRKPLTLDDLQVIHGEIARLEQTVQSFLDFARLPTPRRSKTDLQPIVDQAVELVRVRARQQGVEIVPQGASKSIVANVDQSQLCTVLVNLLINALDAMPSGGRLEVGLERDPAGDIHLTITDTGTGISPAIADRLFTPFTSTKSTGCGLGLSISRRIVEEHGGRIAGHNRPEGGASFTIVLPAQTQEDECHAQAAGGR